MEERIRELRMFPRINTNIFAHIVNDNMLHVAKVLDLSCWGARVKVDTNSLLHHHIKLKFIYKLEYSIGAEIVQKMSDTEYRVKFIFHDLRQSEMLKRDIQRECSANSSCVLCKR